MNIQDVIKFSNDNPVAYVATIDGDMPRVRALGMWFADESGFYFQTGGVKEIPHQLEKNPNVEVCFYHHEGMIGKMLRISGKAEFVDDRALKERLLEERTFLKDMGLTADSKELIIFRISHGQAHFWTMENNLKPKEYIEF
ncbi:MAG: pyridoxamine 5'-phosphate oxidase family protein [Dysgonomonas sp.]|nr:pyridoxamine 5'-phosphate oxidase family protein [Dysgonomonas sp.]